MEVRSEAVRSNFRFRSCNGYHRPRNLKAEPSAGPDTIPAACVEFVGSFLVPWLPIRSFALEACRSPRDKSCIYLPGC